MDWLQRMNAALRYIEENLDGEIDYVQISKMICTSMFHFQKMFSLMSSIPFSEYVRNRRLSKAAFDLQNSTDKVIDVALRYGYKSPTAFTRAFQSFHGVAPSECRNRDIFVKAYPPISFEITIKGAVSMDYKIREQKSFRVVGFKLHTTTKNDEQLKEIPEFWKKTAESGDIKKLIDICQQEPVNTDLPMGILGVCAVPENYAVSNEVDYYIAVATDKDIPAGMQEMVIPKATYAVFSCVGPMPKTLQDLTMRIYTQWLPNSGYEFGNTPDIEVYSDGDISSVDYKSEVWVSVIKK